MIDLLKGEINLLQLSLRKLLLPKDRPLMALLIFLSLVLALLLANAQIWTDYVYIFNSPSYCRTTHTTGLIPFLPLIFNQLIPLFITSLT